MSNYYSSEQQSAAQREAAAKQKAEQEKAAQLAAQKEAARRLAVNNEINSLEKSINSYAQLAASLAASRSMLNNQTNSWQGNLSQAMQSSITNSIVITDVFEGDAANVLLSEFPDSVTKMNGNQESGNKLANQVQNQITSIEDQIYTKRNKISSLRASL